MRRVLFLGAAVVVLVVGFTVNLHTGVWDPLMAYEAQHPQQFGSLLERTDPAANMVVIVGLAMVLVVLAARRRA